MRHYYRHRITGDYWTDLDPQASQLWVVVGPRPFLDSARAMDERNPEFSWAGNVDWEIAVRQAALVEIDPYAEDE